MTIHIFGIRHHGPGSARSLRQALEILQPDVILVEGPPEGDGLLPWLVHSEMTPPVALLVYRPDQPRQAIYYPFAVFSPEWQAIHYGLTHHISVRFMDLPQAHQLGQEAGEEEEAEDQQQSAVSNSDSPEDQIRLDPLGWLGKAAGYSDGEHWWEHLVEQRQDSTDLFTAILEAMTVLRQECPSEVDLRDAQREAYMRKTIRTAEKEGYQTIAVVCGAWHSPALVQMPSEAADHRLLKGLPKTTVTATWVPWTYGRLSYQSGYGAGVASPGWYDHLWAIATLPNPQPSDVAIRWLTQVAQLLRQEQFDASSAHLIEAVRLAESLAALRDCPLPGLAELNEATQTVLCFGSPLPMRLIEEKLIIGERLGAVPDETPMVPLQRDLQQHQKRYRMPAQATEKIYELDLRHETDLARSQLLHRLNLLHLPWGEAQKTSGTGTFKEKWRVQWQPEFAVKLIEAGIWGNTVLDAATAYAQDTAKSATDLPTLTHLLNRVLLAELPDAVNELMHRLQTQAALTSDVGHLMEALPPLTQILRYGSVRQMNRDLIRLVVDHLVARICIGLPGACSSLDDQAADQMDRRIDQVNQAISLLQTEDYLTAWRGVLIQLADQEGLHGLVSGHSCRLLLDAGVWDTQVSSQRLGLALSTATEPAHAAAWVEGFLKGSGLLLLHDHQLWQVLDRWVSGLNSDTFTTLLPLLRRTFSRFSQPERRQMGERVRRGDWSVGTRGEGLEIDRDRANQVLPILAQLLGFTEVLIKTESGNE